MKKSIKDYFPPIGLRIIKSAVAVALCYVVSFIRGNSGIVFYSQLAALWCMQMYVANSWKNALLRILGTLIGAAYGLIFLIFRQYVAFPAKWDEYISAGIISLMIIALLYTTVLVKKKQASYFSCAVFLSIVVSHAGDSNPYLFVWNRFLDTMIGIVIGIGVNCFSLPKDKRKDILFVSGLDDTLLGKTDTLSDYSKVELNRMLDDGLNFTLSTVRTPAALMAPMADIRLKLPVIAMDGAVLYDIKEKTYLKTYVISPQKSKRILELVKEQGLVCFSNVLMEDVLVIYHDESQEEVHNQLIDKLRKSPYRNFVKRPLPETEYVVYFMLLYPKAVIDDFYQVLEKNGITDELRVVRYDSLDFSGYAYIKIYNKNASKENMIEYLCHMINVNEVVTFGSSENEYDIAVLPGDTNRVVRTVKKLYEPLKTPAFIKKHK